MFFYSCFHTLQGPRATRGSLCGYLLKITIDMNRVICSDRGNNLLVFGPTEERLAGRICLVGTYTDPENMNGMRLFRYNGCVMGGLGREV